MKGISVEKAEVTPRGFRHDRAWMLVNNDGRFVSQREIPALAMIDVRLNEDDIQVNFKGETISIGLTTRSEKSITTTVWKDQFTSMEVNEHVSDWFSQMLDSNLKLVTYSDNNFRIKKPSTLNEEIEVSYADGYPYLIIGEASLEDLNYRIGSPIDINRFRPNIVIHTGTAFEEDSWGKVSIGSSNLQVVKPCARCVMTTINQETTERGKEPLYTLSKYRQVGKDILFGVNAILRNGNVIRVGDSVQLIK